MMDKQSLFLKEKSFEADGIRTPSGKTGWNKTTVSNMLRNEKYCGDVLLQKYYVDDFLTHKLRKNDGKLPQYYVEDHHEPIVPKQVYFLTQGELMRRATLKNDPTKIRYGNENALTGRVICGKCDRVMKRYWKEDSDKIDWRCRNKAGAGKENHKSHFSRCGNRFAPEEEAKAAILMAMNRLPAYRDELIRRQAELLVGDMKRIDALMERSREQEADIEQRIKDVPEEDTDQLNYLEGQILRLQAERDKLIVERAYHANQETQVRLLIELVDEMKARETGEAVCSPDETTAACWEYDDFFRRTKADMDGFLSPDGRVNRFVDSAVIRYLKNITVQDDGYDVNFKAGVTVRIGCEDISVAA